MRILIIRHAEPYYPTDSLTEKGFREAEMLSQKLKDEGITDIYVSPLGRAQLTAKPTVEKTGIQPITLEWLREFPHTMNWTYDTDFYKQTRSPWNMPPELWTKDPDIFSNENWQNSTLLTDSGVKEHYEKVCKEFDGLMAKHGLIRDGEQWIIGENYNPDATIALFCHFALGTSLIARSLNMPLVPIWNTIFLPTSSVTTLYMEHHILERPIVHGIFCGIGDTSHLYAEGEPISSSGLHRRSK